jgi:hypothetical protein
MDLTKDEATGAAVSDEDEDDDLKRMKVHLAKIVQDGDLTIESDEDESINSEDAFSEGEAERFSEFFSKRVRFS